jgi:hypothetical protein
MQDQSHPVTDPHHHAVRTAAAWYEWEQALRDQAATKFRIRNADRVREQEAAAYARYVAARDAWFAADSAAASAWATGPRR